MFLHPLCNYIKSGKGKRIRPILFFLSQRLVGHSDTNTIVIPVFLEMLHTATLIHDDVVDKAVKRRARKTMSVIWGDKTAVLFGDYLFAKALELGISTKNFKILELITELVRKMSEGELRQVFKSHEIKKDIYYNIIKDKTAILFRASCMLAGLSQSGNEKDIMNLGRFGELFGMGYQIKDDILDIAGKSEFLGKTVGQDLSDGKFTLPFIMVYNKASFKERKYLHRLISDSSAENLGIVYDYIKKYQGVKLAERELKIINSEAGKILKSFNVSRHRELLGKLLEYNYLRKR
ncbi:MAG: polyprenyl synthetase family protein [bacterium]